MIINQKLAGRQLRFGRRLPVARIARAFNTVYFEDLGKTVNKRAETIGIPVAGGDQEGLEAAVELARHAGWSLSWSEASANQSCSMSEQMYTQQVRRREE